MELLDALAELKTIAIERIAEAARKGDAATIRALADTVEQIEADLKVTREIEARRVGYARELTNPGTATATTPTRTSMARTPACGSSRSPNEREAASS